jgi:hypothetical protein
MYYPLDQIDALGERLRARLARAGVRTTRHLLERGANAAGRAALASATGASEVEILVAVQIGDLMRVKGAAGNYAALMVAAGAVSVTVLARADPAALAVSLREANGTRKLVRRMPTSPQINGWIEDAATLQPIVT